MAEILTQEDVKRLLAEPSGSIREQTAEKLSSQYTSAPLSASERTLAEEIFRLMVKDAEVRVREALAKNLKESRIVPHDVALTLAQDVDSVSLPILETSEALTSDDLVKIIRANSASPERQKAVARRKTVQSDVADALVEVGDADVAATLVANEGADLSEKTMLTMVDKFKDDDYVQDVMVHRSVLPVTVAEQLVHRVSEGLRDYLLRHHELSPDMAADLITQARERATISLSAESTENQVEALVTQMKDHKRLTPSIVLRAICMGDLKFFEYSLAIMAGIPVVNARELIHDKGKRGLSGLCEHAGLTAGMYPAVRAAVDIIKETAYDGEANDRERYQRRVLERVLTYYADLESDDLEYLLAKLNVCRQPLCMGETDPRCFRG